MTQEIKILAGIIVATIIILLGGVFLLSQNASPTPTENGQKIDSKNLVSQDSHKIGTSSATVTIVEFADFQCPACAATDPSVKEVVEEYKDRILFVFRHFPLPQHQNAKLSAQAAEAAGAQGKFFEMSQKLYEDQETWATDTNASQIFISYAQSLELDVEKFTKDMKENSYLEKIVTDKSYGESIGVNATPTFYINGEKFTQPVSYNNLKQAIEEKLQ